MENTYVVYVEEYYFSVNTLSTILRKKVYNVSYSREAAEEVKAMIEESLKKSVASGELNANNEMLTTYQADVRCLEGRLTIEESKAAVINDDYTWGHVNSGRANSM